MTTSMRSLTSVVAAAHLIPSIDNERNHLLAAMTAEDYEQLAPAFEVVQIRAKHVLTWPDEPLRYVYFPRTGVASMLVLMEDGAAIQCAMIGSEGVIGLEMLLGNGNPIGEIVQVIDGQAVRVPAAVLRARAELSGDLLAVLYRYSLDLMHQYARAVGCSRLHRVTERVALWLLMCQDRVGCDTFPITHERMANVIGIRRASVTQAAGTLQRQGLIEYGRGSMTVHDRVGLEAIACEDYRPAGLLASAAD
ncbi:MAG TPA: Crp/Fnr family transcriptional regulator [Chloroflexota bacterium]